MLGIWQEGSSVHGRCINSSLEILVLVRAFELVYSTTFWTPDFGSSEYPPLHIMQRQSPERSGRSVPSLNYPRVRLDYASDLLYQATDLIYEHPEDTERAALLEKMNEWVVFPDLWIDPNYFSDSASDWVNCGRGLALFGSSPQPMSFMFANLRKNATCFCVRSGLTKGGCGLRGTRSTRWR